MKMILLFIEFIGLLALGGAAAYGVKELLSKKQESFSSEERAAALNGILEERDPLIRYSLTLNTVGLHEEAHRDGWLIARKPQNSPLSHFLDNQLPGGIRFPPLLRAFGCPTHLEWIFTKICLESLPYSASVAVRCLLNLQPMKEHVYSVLLKNDQSLRFILHSPLPLLGEKRMKSACYALENAGIPSDPRLEASCVSVADWISGFARRNYK
jgi:hypothetical protein